MIVEHIGSFYDVICDLLLQAKLKSIEAELKAALQSSENKSTKISSESTGEGIESAAVTKKLEEELQKRDALIEVWKVLTLHKEVT